MSHNYAKEHVITLLSNGCSSIYTTNTQSSFTTSFNRPMNLTGNWVVGISEITLNKNCSHASSIEPTEHEYYSPYRNYLKLNDQNIQTTSEVNNNDDDQYSYLFIYLDIIEPSFTGNQLTKCARSFLKENRNRLTLEFKNIHYFPLNYNNISDISVLIADQSGSKIQFVTSYLPNVVTLHFMKID